MCINLSSIKRCEEWKINKKKIKYNKKIQNEIKCKIIISEKKKIQYIKKQHKKDIHETIKRCYRI